MSYPEVKREERGARVPALVVCEGRRKATFKEADLKQYPTTAIALRNGIPSTSK
ncbi:hypothetical protein [Paraburkholderia sp. BR14320]|uniref:hypothetical protein n=1 Tax=unclassified Paraburkholderia TaxID=2615204 RepID=UPI0034CF1F9A